LLIKDKQGVFKFASLQSEWGSHIKRHLALPQNYTDSIIVWSAHDQEAYTQSKAVMYITKKLPNYRWAYYLLKMLPTVLSDRCYRLVARYRKRIVKNQEHCNLQLRQQYQERFLY
jgi:predicted DCC family thiol-disulfide oxidoreductase YuxK